MKLGLSVFWLPYSDPQAKPFNKRAYCFCEIHNVTISSS